MKIKISKNRLLDIVPDEHKFRIRTEKTLPDGDYIDIYVEEQRDRMRVSDLAETTRWLRMAMNLDISEMRSGVMISFNPNQVKEIISFCEQEQVEYVFGAISVYCGKDEDVLPCVDKIALISWKMSRLFKTNLKN